MGSLNPFKKPKMPEVKQIEVPTEKNSAKDLSQAAEDEKQRRKNQKGRAATILSNQKGILGDDSSGVATKRLLGG